MNRALAALVALLVLAPAAPAAAATLSRGPNGSIDFTGSSGVDNTVTVSGTPASIMLSDPGDPIADPLPPGCTRNGAAAATCEVAEGIRQPWTVNGGDGNDRVDARGFAAGGVISDVETIEGSEGHDGVLDSATDATPATLRGYGGDDYLYGGTSADELDGGPGDDRMESGGGGDDRFNGGPGNDKFDGGPGRDSGDGGAGIDELSFSREGAAVEIDLADLRPSDQLAQGSGFENVAGSDLNDTIRGTDAGERLAGGRGDDTLEGRGGADFLIGEQGNDTLLARDGAGDALLDCDGGIFGEPDGTGDRALVDGSEFARGCESVERAFPPANGINASAGARIAGGFVVGSRERPRATVRADRSIDIAGRITDEQGRPITGATLRIDRRIERSGESRARNVARTPPVTDGDGRFRYRVSPGPSRRIYVVYDPRTPTAPTRPIELVLRLTARATVRLTTDRRTAGPGRRIRFSGTVSPLFSSGKRVALQARERRRWVTVASAIVRNARFGIRFRAPRRRGGYTFRARIAGQPGYPYRAGNSRALRLRVR